MLYIQFHMTEQSCTNFFWAVNTVWGYSFILLFLHTKIAQLLSFKLIKDILIRMCTKKNTIFLW